MELRKKLTAEKNQVKRSSFAGQKFYKKKGSQRTLFNKLLF